MINKEGNGVGFEGLEVEEDKDRRDGEGKIVRKNTNNSKMEASLLNRNNTINSQLKDPNFTPSNSLTITQQFILSNYIELYIEKLSEKFLKSLKKSPTLT